MEPCLLACLRPLGVSPFGERLLRRSMLPCSMVKRIEGGLLVCGEVVPQQALLCVRLHAWHEVSKELDGLDDPAPVLARPAPRAPRPSPCASRLPPHPLRHFSSLLLADSSSPA